MTDQHSDSEKQLRDLIGAHGRTVRACLARREHDRASVEELWVDVFAVAAERLDELVALPVGVQQSWLLRTASNLTANHSRRNATRRSTLERLRHEPLAIAVSAEEEVELRADDQDSVVRSGAVRAALDRLNPADRQVLVLHAIGYDGPRIAVEISLSESATRKRLMRARRAFRDVYVDPLINTTSAQEER